MAQDSKWESKRSAELSGISAEQLWPLLEDFCAFHKWLPNLDSKKSGRIEGEYGKPGLIRHGVFIGDENDAKYIYEKLLSMDPIQRTLSYEVQENNLGFKFCVTNVKVIEVDGGCKIEWSFVTDPVEGMRFEDFIATIDLSVKNMAEGMRKELQTTGN